MVNIDARFVASGIKGVSLQNALIAALVVGVEEEPNARRRLLIILRHIHHHHLLLDLALPVFVPLVELLKLLRCQRLLRRPPIPRAASSGHIVRLQLAVIKEELLEDVAVPSLRAIIIVFRVVLNPMVDDDRLSDKFLFELDDDTVSVGCICPL